MAAVWTWGGGGAVQCHRICLPEVCVFTCFVCRARSSQAWRRLSLLALVPWLSQSRVTTHEPSAPMSSQLSGKHLWLLASSC